MNKWKKILLRVFTITFWTGAGIGFMVLCASALTEQKNIKVRQVKVSIDSGKDIFFVNSDDVFEIINHNYPSGLVGMRLDTLNLKDLEKDVSRNPFIQTAELYTTIRGDVTVKVEQREPIARVINNNRVSFYIDRNGVKMPASTKFTPRVPVFCGDIKINSEPGRNTADSILFNSMYSLALYIDGNSFWKAQVQQVNVTEKGEFEIIPMLGNQTILLGNANELDEKFRRAMIYYKEVLKNVDASKYSTVNVKYKNQIICTKYN